jgi:hypothetical protein
VGARLVEKVEKMVEFACAGLPLVACPDSPGPPTVSRPTPRQFLLGIAASQLEKAEILRLRLLAPTGAQLGSIADRTTAIFSQQDEMYQASRLLILRNEQSLITIDSESLLPGILH